MASRPFLRALALGAIILCLGAGQAQATAFTYQGQLKALDAPATGAHDFRFTLYDAEADGAALGTVTLDNVPVTNGLFTVVLDFGAAAFPGASRWLGIAVRPGDSMGDYTTLIPRQAILPVPYAIYAESAGAAQNAWKQGGNAFGVTGVLGTTDNRALEMRVYNYRALRLEPHATSPNLLGGHADNSITGGVWGGTISGGGATGYGHRLTDAYTTIGGGLNNRAGDDAGSATDAAYATIGGGFYNVAGAYAATVAGGRGNDALGSRSAIGGGEENAAAGNYATVGGGYSNTASLSSATVAGGSVNSASHSGAAVGGGYSNLANGQYTTVGGGYMNTASGLCATVGGGSNNTASENSDAVGGGYNNLASGPYATVAGGSNNTAAGYYSFAAGRRAKANHDGAFVWGDSTYADVASTAANQFIVRAYGGIWLGTTSAPSIPSGRFINTSMGAYLTTGGTWTNACDRAQKDGFMPVNPREVLRKVAGLPITRWHYKAEGAGVQHLGPVAQDFHAAFGLGQDDVSISTVDADGVALAAIQGLYQLMQEKDARIAAQQRELDALKERLATLEALVKVSATQR